MTWRGRGPLVLAAFAACVSVATAARFVVFEAAANQGKHRPLGIRGDATRLLYPGASQRLDLRLRNRRGIPLLVTRIRVRLRVDRAHRRAGCTGRDYAIRQMDPGAFPIELRAHAVRRLSRLGVASYPQIAMRNSLTRNQDACQGATLRLRYRGWVLKAR